MDSKYARLENTAADIRSPAAEPVLTIAGSSTNTPESFEGRLIAYVNGCPSFSDAELAVISQGIRTATVSDLKMIKKMTIDEFRELKAKEADSKESKSPSLNKRLSRLSDTAFLKLQENIKKIVFEKDVPDDAVDPRLETQACVSQFKLSKDRNSGQLSRVMNEYKYTRYVPDNFYLPLLSKYKDIIKQCKPRSIDDLNEGEDDLLDTQSKIKMQKVASDIIQQCLNDLLDEQGNIKASLKKALGLDQIKEHIDDDVLLHKLVSGYIANQLFSFLTSDVTRDLEMSDSDPRKGALALLQAVVMRQNKIPALEQHPVYQLLHQRCELKRRIKQLDETLKATPVGSPLREAGETVRKECRNLAVKLLQDPVKRYSPKHINELRLLNTTIQHANDAIRTPSKKAAEDLDKDAQQISGKPSIWKKVLGAVCMLAGAVASVLGFGLTPVTLGASLVLPAKIGGPLIAAGGTLFFYSSRQQGLSKQVSTLAKAVAKEVPAADEKKASLSKGGPRS